MTGEVPPKYSRDGLYSDKILELRQRGVRIFSDVSEVPADWVKDTDPRYAIFEGVVNVDKISAYSVNVMNANFGRNGWGLVAQPGGNLASVVHRQLEDQFMIPFEDEPTYRTIPEIIPDEEGSNVIHAVPAVERTIFTPEGKQVKLALIIGGQASRQLDKT